MAESLVVGGFVPFSTVDYPDHLAAVVFCQGCPWRCLYCHNRHLLSGNIAGTVDWGATINWLSTRKNRLEAVVLSGGEPLLQSYLPQAVKEIKALGFKVALHTAGGYLARFEEILPCLDWVGFDVKGPFTHYQNVTGVANGALARRSLIRLIKSGVAHEIRCTVDERVLKIEDAHSLASDLAALGVSSLVLQQMRNTAGQSQVISRAFIEALSQFLLVQVR